MTAPTGTPVGDGLPPLRDVIRTHDLAAKKSLGQNFILDLNLTRRIARVTGPLPETTVVEVGIDFSDEGDVPTDLVPKAIEIARAVEVEIAEGLAGAGRGAAHG